MRILVSKPDALGDQVLAAGVVQALLRHRPAARVVWHVRTGMEVIASLLADTEIFRPDPTAGAEAEAQRLWASTRAPIIVVPYGLHPFAGWDSSLEARYAWWGAFLRATSWDLALAPVVNRTGLTDFTVTASQATVRAGFATNGACQPMIEAAFTHLPTKRVAFTLEVPSSLHESEFDQLARMLGAVVPEATLLPPVFPVASPPALATPAAAAPILLAPGVGENRARAWPLEHFVRLAAELRARGHLVGWIEGPFDAATFAQLPPEESSARQRFSADALPALAATLRSAPLLICHDTAYVHLAAALDVPTVALFGAGQKSRFVPRFGRVQVVQGDPACRGCQWQCAFPAHLCVRDLPLAAVLTAAQAQLAAPAAGHARLPIPLPFLPRPPDAMAELERVRDWFQEELDFLRWDGWARLQIINDVLVRLQARDAALAALTVERDALVQRLAAPTLPPLPRLSVIIPMGRPERADGTLRALANQTFHPSAWEVVVVGVGASTLPARYPGLPLVPEELETNLLPPHTRARGVARATGEWLLFVDDDVRLAPDFLEMLRRILVCQPPAVGPEGRPVGAIGVRLPGGRGTYFEHLTDISNFWSQQSPRRAVPHPVWFLYSAALVVRTAAYHQAGGFNITLPNGEDVDLTQRITAVGYALAYEPALVAHHHHGRDSVWRMWRYFWRNGNAAQYFFAQHGGVCAYSVRTVLTRCWLDLRMNRDFQRTQQVRLGARTPWILLNYLILEASLEWHYQAYLWRARRYRDLPARTPSDRDAAAAFRAREAGHRLRAAVRYGRALLRNLADPVRR